RHLCTATRRPYCRHSLHAGVLQMQHHSLPARGVAHESRNRPCFVRRLSDRPSSGYRRTSTKRGSICLDNLRGFTTISVSASRLCKSILFSSAMLTRIASSRSVRQLLELALERNKDEITCTSEPRYGLTLGAHITEEVIERLRSAKALFLLATKASRGK